MKTLLGLSRPTSARHLHSAPASCWGYRLWGQGVQRGVGPHRFTIFPLGLGMWIIYVPDARLCSINCAAGYPCRSRGGRPLYTLFLLSWATSPHTTCFSWWWGAGAKNEWAVETQTQNATLGLLVLLGPPAKAISERFPWLFPLRLRAGTDW